MRYCVCFFTFNDFFFSQVREELLEKARKRAAEASARALAIRTAARQSDQVRSLSSRPFLFSRCLPTHTRGVTVVLPNSSYPHGRV